MRSICYAFTLLTAGPVDSLALVQERLQPQAASSADAEWARMNKKLAIEVATASNHGASVHASEANQHIAEMKARLAVLKKDVLTRAKASMDKDMAAEKQRLAEEKKKEDDEKERLERLKEKNSHVAKKEVVSAKRLAEEGLISRAPPSGARSMAKIAGAYLNDEYSYIKTRKPMNKTYLVDNRLLLAHTHGLGYRRTKSLEDKVDGKTAPWGSYIKGVDEGDGWIRVGDMFLPTTVGDVAVVSFHDVSPHRYEAPETEKDRENKLKADERKVKLVATEKKVKAAVGDALLNYGKGLRNEVTKAGHDIKQTLDHAHQEDLARAKFARARHAHEQAVHRQEAEFHALVHQQEEAVANQQVELKKQEEKLEKAAKKDDLKWANTITKQDKLFNTQVRAKNWARSHYVRAAPGKECPVGWSPVTDQTSCKLAVSALSNEGFLQGSHAWDNHPNGCYIHVRSQLGAFNMAESGSLNAEDERICARDTSASVRERVHQELAVKRGEENQHKLEEKRLRQAEEASDAIAQKESIARAAAEHEAGTAPELVAPLPALSMHHEGATISMDSDAEEEHVSRASPVDNIVLNGLKASYNDYTDKAKDLFDEEQTREAQLLLST